MIESHSNSGQQIIMQNQIKQEEQQQQQDRNNIIIINRKINNSLQYYNQELQNNQTYAFLKAEHSTPSSSPSLSSSSTNKENIFQEIDLSVECIRKQLKIEGCRLSGIKKLNHSLNSAQIQQLQIMPIYAYRDYINTFEHHPQSEKIISYHKARVRSISDQSQQETILHHNNHNLQTNSKNILFETISQQQQSSQFGQMCNLPFLQKISFSVDSEQNLGEKAIAFMQNYPVNSILSQKDKKIKKLAGKLNLNLASAAQGLENNNSDEGKIDQYSQFSIHQQNLLNYINLAEIISNPKPEKTLITLIQAQFYYFIIGDYKKLKRLKHSFLLDDDSKICQNNSNSNTFHKNQTVNYQQNKNNKNSDNNNNNFKDAEDLSENCYNYLHSDSSSNDNSSMSEININDQKKQYDINDFIAFKSQSTTSKLTKMQISVINDPFQGFSQHQKEKHNPNRNQFYNLPKYSMVFILELLSQKNLKRLGVSAEYRLLMQKIVYNVKQSAKIKEQNKKIMYNHNHYNTLFLSLNINNTSEVMNQADLKNLHLKIFKVENILHPFDTLYMNILKKVIERIIMIQLELIQQFPLTQYIINNKNLYQFEKSKINYIERVISGISKLREGEIIKRF